MTRYIFWTVVPFIVLAAIILLWGWMK